MTPAELAGGFGVPTSATVSGQIEDHYARRVQALPVSTQRLLLFAAADPTGDATLLWRDTVALGIGRDAAAAAHSERLLEIGSQVRFRHPLVRSAVYAAAAPEERSRAHVALAEATDPQHDPERRVWHLAAAATGYDESLASELERAADQAQARAGLPAAAEFFQRSVALTAEPRRRADRALAAAQAHLQAGAFDAARSVLAVAASRRGRRSPACPRRATQGTGRGGREPGREAPVRLLHAARRLESLDVGLAERRTSRRGGQPSSRVSSRHRAAASSRSPKPRAAPPAVDPRPCDLLLDGLATVITEGRRAAAPTLALAIDLFRTDQVSTDDWIQWGRSATTAAFALWDVDNWAGLSTRQVELARTSGALAPLVLALNFHAVNNTVRGNFETATSLVAEQHAVKEVTGIRMASYGAQMLAAYQGRPAELATQTTDIEDELIERGDGYSLEVASWATSLLNNGLGRYTDALAAAWRWPTRSRSLRPSRSPS